MLPCSQCRKSFKTESGLRIHFILLHKKIKVAFCERCGTQLIGYQKRYCSKRCQSSVSRNELARRMEIPLHLNMKLNYLSEAFD